MSEPNDATSVPEDSDEPTQPTRPIPPGFRGSQDQSAGPGGHGGQGRPEQQGQQGQQGGIPDVEPFLRELFGPDAQFPPEVTQLLGALRADPSGSPLAGMIQAQFRSLFGAQSPTDRIATATDLARKVVAAKGDPSVGVAQRRAVEDAVAVARLWLDPVTTLDAPAGPALALSGAEWVEATTPRWYALVEPVADGVAAAAGAAMRAQVEQLGGLTGDGAGEGGPEALGSIPGLDALLGGLGGLGGAGGGSGGIGGLFGQLGPALEQLSAGMFGAQIGQAVGTLAADVLSGTEVGLPLLDAGAVALLPERVAEFSRGLEMDEGQVRLYLAVREAARVRLFAEVPWLAAQLEAAVRDYGRNVVIDTDAIDEAVRSVELTDLSNLAAVQEAFSQANLFGRRTTPEQDAALVRLEATLALVEGWVDLVTDRAVAAHLPQAQALGEAVRRRRAGGPAQRAFAGLVGLELRPRRLRDARNLWAALEDAGGIALRDGSWAHPDLAPTATDLDDPMGYVDRRQHPAAPDAMDAELDRLLSGQDPTQE